MRELLRGGLFRAFGACGAVRIHVVPEEGGELGHAGAHDADADFDEAAKVRKEVGSGGTGEGQRGKEDGNWEEGTLGKGKERKEFCLHKAEDGQQVPREIGDIGGGSAAGVCGDVLVEDDAEVEAEDGRDDGSGWISIRAFR